MFLINELSFSNQLALSARHFILSTQLFFRSTGNFMSVALILKLVNPQFDDRLLIDLRLQYEKKNKFRTCFVQNCFECQNKNKKLFLYKTCSELVFF